MVDMLEGYMAFENDDTDEVTDLSGTHPSPLVFPVGTRADLEQVCWDTKYDQHLFIYGSVVDGIDVVLHNLTKQAMNHENHWSLYSANSFGAGKHAHGLSETAWHKTVNLNLYLTMMKELVKVYNDRVETMKSYRMGNFGELRRVMRTNELLIILPDLVDVIADERKEVRYIVDVASMIALNGHKVGMHGVFVFDRMGDNNLYADVLSSASSVILRRLPGDNLLETNIVTEIPEKKGCGLFKTQDNSQIALFQTP